MDAEARSRSTKPYHDAPSVHSTDSLSDFCFAPIIMIFTAGGGIGEQLQRQFWHPRWKRVDSPDSEADDLEMGIGPRRRKAPEADLWLARFGVDV